MLHHTCTISIFIYLQVIGFHSRVVQQHCGSSVSRAHAESFNHSQNELLGRQKFFLAESFRTIQQERQIHGTVTRALGHQRREGQGGEGDIGRRWCGSGPCGQGGTSLAAQGVVVTVTSEEDNTDLINWFITKPKYPQGDAVLPYLAVFRVIVVQDDLVAVGDSLALMDTHLTLRGVHAAHGHLVQ